MGNPATKNNLFDAAKTLLIKFGLRKFIQEPPVSTVARGLADKNGNSVLEADGTTLAPVTVGGVQTLTNKTLAGAVISKTLRKGTVTTLTGSADAIDISLGDVFILNRSAAVDAATLADPGAGDEGRIIWIKNGTTQANTITITSGLGGSGASYDTLTFTNVVASNVSLRAYGTKWYLVGQHLCAIA